MPLSLPPHRDQSSPRPFLPGSLLPGFQAYIVALGSVTLSAAVLKGTAGVGRGSFRLCLLVLEFSEQVLELGADEVASGDLAHGDAQCRSEEHTSELQSRGQLVCRLLLEKKKTNKSR